MTGQPTWFDVSNLQVIQPAGEMASHRIIEAGDNFDLKATFHGDEDELIWMLYEFFGAEYTVNFYAEGMGFGIPNANLGNVTDKLAWHGGPYEATLKDININTPGVYRVACTVTFPGVPGEVAAFRENVLIQIHAPTPPD